MLGFVLRDSTKVDAIDPRSVGMVPWVWPGCFGTSLTITMYRRDIEPALHARVFLPRSNPVARQILESREFIAVLFRDGAPRTVFQVQLPLGEGAFALSTHLDNLGRLTSENADEAAHFWETCEHWRKHLEPAQRMSISWIESYAKRLTLPSIALAQGDLESILDDEHVPLLLRSIFIDLSPEGAVRAALKLYTLAQSEGLPPLFDALKKLYEQSPMMAWYAGSLVELSLWTSVATNEGRRLPWWDNESQQLKYIELNAHSLYRKGILDDYWRRMLIYDSQHIDWGNVINGDDAPCDPGELMTIFEDLVRNKADVAIDVEAMLASLDRTTVALPGPLTLERIGAFVSHRAFWAGGDLAIRANTNSGEFFVFGTAKNFGVLINWYGFPLAGVEPPKEDRHNEQIEALRAAFVPPVHSLIIREPIGLLSIDDWQEAPLELELERCTKRPFPQTQWRNNGAIRPSDLYVYLKARFGEPNGMMSALRGDASDNLFHWQYNIRVNEEMLSILASSSGVIFRASTPNPVTRGQQWEILRRIKGDLAQRGRDLSRVRDALEPWVLLLNPYQRLVRLIETLCNRLDRLDLREPEPLTLDSSEEEREAYMGSVRRWAEAEREAADLSFFIETYTPIMVEAFVNFVLFALAKPELRADKTLYHGVLRQSLDLRIRSLHLHCRGFASGVDFADERYVAFGKLRDKRNQILHGNLDPKEMVIDRLYFDGTVPVFHSEGSVMHRLIRSATTLSGPLSAKQSIRDAEAFVGLVYAAMTHDVQREIADIASREEIGQREDTGRLGLLFSGAVELPFDLPDGTVIPARDTKDSE